jgi:opacity protein-like surface antigen
MKSYLLSSALLVTLASAANAADIADAMPRRASFGESVNLIV